MARITFERGDGCLYLPAYRDAKGQLRHSSKWWWKFRGRVFPTGQTDRELAEQWVEDRLAGRKAIHRDLYYEDCERMLTDRHATEKRRAPLDCNLSHLRRYFSGWRAVEITEDVWIAYARHRLAMTNPQGKPYAVATVNLEGARLRRMLRLAWKSGRLPQQPSIPLLPGAKVRRGWLEDGVLSAILAELPDHYRPLVRFLRLTGWRRGEGVGLEWRRVDQGAREIRLDTSKTGEPRCLPYDTYPALKLVIEGQAEARVDLCPWVFPAADGRTAMNKDALHVAWVRARRRAGVGPVTIHDLRRTFVRDCERAGVPRTVAMSITGHRSEAIYRRYAITAVRDQQDGLAKLAALEPSNGSKVTAIR